jgi:hypothetical protein
LHPLTTHDIRYTKKLYSNILKKESNMSDLPNGLPNGVQNGVQNGEVVDDKLDKFENVTGWTDDQILAKAREWVRPI